MWNDAIGYEKYVGHWSRSIAPRFLSWLALPPGLKWLDVACGTGALTSAILANHDPAQVIGLDASEDYIASARKNCQENRATFITGDANRLLFPNNSFDVCVSGLALNFMNFDHALAEQCRVVRRDGTIAAYVWDYSGGYEFARRFWDAALRIDSRAATYDPGRKAIICREPNMRDALLAAGCSVVETCAFDDWGEFPSPEAYWHAFDSRQGSTFEYLSLLTDRERLQLQEAVLIDMPSHGPVKMKVRALAVRGVRT